MKIKVTLVQIRSVKRLEKIERILSNCESDLVIFPEATYLAKDYKFEKELKKISRKHKKRIIIGIIVEEKNKTYNYSYYFSSKKIERYQKVHAHWTRKDVPGDKFIVISTTIGKIGLLICYDLAFQETGRILALKGADIIVVISAVPSEFSFRYNLIRLQAMALNNQVFAINCCKPGRKYSGHGAIFDPQGNKIIEEGDYAQINTKTLDLSLIKKWRRKEKIFPYRNPRLYSQITETET
jgi:predicted amidohydrolase